MSWNTLFLKEDRSQSKAMFAAHTSGVPQPSSDVQPRPLKRHARVERTAEVGQAFVSASAGVSGGREVPRPLTVTTRPPPPVRPALGHAPMIQVAASARLADLPLPARGFVVATLAAGLALFLLRPPGALDNAVLFAALLAVSVLMAIFKVALPLSRGAATMTLAYAPDFACLMLLGANEAMVIAAVSVWCQCTIRLRERWPLHRTLFSVATIAISIQVVGLVYRYAGGTSGHVALGAVVVPILAAATTYFLTNTLFVAAAVALTARTSIARVWRDDFLWSAPGYFLAAGVAVPAALAIEAEAYWIVPLTIAPLYLTYHSYKTYLRRVEDEQAHARELAAEKTQLAVERERLAVTLSNIGDGVITTDVRGEIVLLNQTAEDLMGMTQHQACGRAFLDVVHHVAPAARAHFVLAVEHVLVHGVRVQVAERPVFTVAEGGRIFECSGSPIRNGDGTIAGSIWVFHDVTDAIRLEQERSRAVRLESLAVLAGGLAHDFNNILTGVTGNLSLARLEASEPEQVTKRLAQAERACLRARGITSQLLTFSKGGAPVKTEASIRALVEETTTFVLRGSAVAPVFVVRQDLWHVNVDVCQMSQVISNLVINAKQAMPAGGVVTIEMANVERPCDEFRDGVHLRAGRFVSISIADQGVGVPEAHLHRIFDPYFTTKPTGSGLGLATTYSIIAAHGGYIGVESVVDAGTCFLLHLPASDGMSSQVVDATPASTVADGGGRALIVDDEEMIRDVAASMFERLGYETVTTRDGTEAVRRFRESMRDGRPFDVVVMDLTIPAGMGGREAVVLLREMDPDVRVVASSGYVDDPIAVDYEQWGFCGMIAKPYVFEDVQWALAGLRSRDQASRSTTAG